MEIMENEGSGEPAVGSSGAGMKDRTEEKKESVKTETAEGAKEDVFSEENVWRESRIEQDGREDIVVTPEDKAAFIDSVVSNTRFTKDYELFGGKVRLTLRSLTSDEVNALAAWTAKVGTVDSAGLVSGRYRKYLLAAHVARLDGVEMPPLEEPLYETLGKDGKTVEKPGWIGRAAYWDGIGYGRFAAIMGCVGDFDALYAILCSKAEEANFWGPDTP